MRARSLTSAFFAIGATSALLLGSAALGPPVLGSGGHSRDGFADRVAGTYLVEIPARGETYLFAISADGRLLSEDSNDFGNGVPAATQSAFYGTWKRTGHRRIVYTVLNISFDGGGGHTTFVRHTATVVFDSRYRTFRQEGTFAVFTAVQDPLDPVAIPIATGEFSGSGRRIPARVGN